jgi:hypothetical protein
VQLIPAGRQAVHRTNPISSFNWIRSCKAAEISTWILTRIELNDALSSRVMAGVWGTAAHCEFSPLFFFPVITYDDYYYFWLIIWTEVYGCPTGPMFPKKKKKDE